LADLLKKMTIKNFKGYSTLQTIDFASPNGKEGSGISAQAASTARGKAKEV
jgi:hypothetical protein